MSDSSSFPRGIIIFGVALPLAALLGYLLATPEALSSMAIVGLVIGVLLLPMILKWHHPLLILTWNGAMNAFFLPGRPSFWMLFAGISFGLTFLSCILNKEQKFQQVPAITWSLVLLAVVVVVTAKLTGGIGVRALGSAQYGGKRYVFIVAAILGYFALSGVRIRPDRVQMFAVLFLLSGLTYVISNLAYVGGPSLWFLFYAFPVELALAHAFADFNPGELMTRLVGVSYASLAVCNVLLLRYGVRGLLDLRHTWRILLFVGAAGATLLGGFRSHLLMIVMLFSIQFCIERLYRTRALLVLIVCTLIGSIALVPFVSKLPLSIQRTLSIVPFLKVDPTAKVLARATIEWRVEMWRLLLREIPQYLVLGKGFAINPTDLFLAEESMRRGFVESYYSSVITGDYHNGFLSLIIPLGIFGVISFGCMLWFGGRTLYRNWKFGDPSHQNINTFLLSFFVMKVICYFVVYGSFYNDLAAFLGIIGFSVAVNGVVVQKAVEKASFSAEPILSPAHA